MREELIQHLIGVLTRCQYLDLVSHRTNIAEVKERENNKCGRRHEKPIHNPQLDLGGFNIPGFYKTGLDKFAE